ncbi:dTDP-4-dehydrorhamnose 3,5-epimerase [Desulfitobacterium hafniense]|uniref:dTDP-4-dehydrorhamnose 3,5-epimerase n=1 Tax=Desulfitobacterium hafniense TaxID=49338 RepID=A0A0W1JKM3_DESHA|nr:dTDP-4-dehydrorhamnose 3,5-epimerase [Desulfitobacterium hafniense]KTE92006.1 dTDP-4-dehydrorhamnose 3,5-epimerase [Desulfitobacterium hafniense]
MGQFLFTDTKLEGLKVIEPFLVEDNRGFFLKSYEKDIFAENGVDTDIFEHFESYSVKGVIRGLHFQSQKPQAKLVRALAGEIFDVAVDLRPESSTLGQWEGAYLSAENHKALYIPEGFAHGFLVISENALVSYLCSGKYLKEYDTGIRWDDPKIGIEWPVRQVKDIIISEKDKTLQYYKEYLNSLNWP